MIRYETVSLALHETNPGHHLQASYMLEQDWPLFRKVMEDRIYNQVVSVHIVRGGRAFLQCLRSRVPAFLGFAFAFPRSRVPVYIFFFAF